jgi:hypothetical protein
VTRFAIDPAAFLSVARDECPPHESHQLVAPNSLRSRTLELLLAEVRAGDLDERRALELHERLTEIKVRLLGDRVSRRTAWDLARRHDWRDLREAEYIAVASLQANALVTLEPELAKRAAGLVPLAVLEQLYVPS